MMLQISEIISRLPILCIAKESGFVKRADYKIDPINFLLSFFHMISAKTYTQSDWAKTLSIFLGKTISSQALQKKLSYRHIEFAERFLEIAVRYSLAKVSVGGKEFLSFFNNILVTDSTCLSMPKILNKFFPGSHSKKGDAATARIQLTMELKSDALCKIDIKSFRDNDQSYAFNILKVAKPGDLVIRDLGYLVIDSLVAMMGNGIFFISRLNNNIHVFDNQGVKLDLLKRLKKEIKHNVNAIDIQVKISKKLVPVRLIVLKTPKEIALKRVDKAKKDRHSKANHSEQYYEMLNYTILITNISLDVLTPKQLFYVYGFRWRIECIFKCWKSHMNLQRLFTGKQNNNPSKPYILLLLMLGWISLTHNLIFIPLTSWFSTKDKIPNGSLNKMAHLVINYDSLLRLKNVNDQFIRQFMKYYGTYQNKKGKNTYLENIYMLI